MKKFLFGILTFLGIGLSFCSALTIQDPELCKLYTGTIDGPDSVVFQDWNISLVGTYFMGGIYDLSNGYADTAILTEYRGEYSLNFYEESYYYYSAIIFPSDGCSSNGGGSSTPSTFDIDVYYNNGNSVETITCDGTQAIDIRGLSTITSTNTFTPYYNISYTDEDNQKLTESYSKDILYLENGQFKKTYTGNNDWILSVQGGSENSFSGYLPTFEITGGINEPTESGNIFNNFAENSLKFTLSNIPSYIQYVILLFILFFILGFIRKFKRK